MLATGCGLSSHTPDGSVPLAEFCDAFFGALCEPLERCECGTLALARCALERRELCAGFPSPALQRAVEEGRLRYDAVAATALVDQLHARAARCASFVDAVGWRARDLYRVGGVFEGTLEAGAPCEALGFELISECALGSCAPVGDARVCRAAVGPGEACDELHQCVDLDATLTRETGLEELSLRCAEVDGAPRCVSRRLEGEPCERSAECAVGRCVEERCRAVSLGDPCGSSRECESRYCDAARRCAPGDAPDGALCEAPSACASGVCAAGRCAPPGCGTF